MIILNENIEVHVLETKPSHTVYAWSCPTCFAGNTMTVFGRMNPVMGCRICRRFVVKRGGKWVSRKIPC